MTVPGAVDAWVQLNRDHGSMPLDRLLLPAIGYARHGYPITQRVARDFASQVNSLDSDARGVFTRDGGPDFLAPAMPSRRWRPRLRGSATE